jgi:hypothetical protein
MSVSFVESVYLAKIIRKPKGDKMFRKSIAFVSLAIFTITFTQQAVAWDDVGHKITAYIAWQRMTPDVRAKVIKVLLEAPEDSQLATFYLPYGSRTDESKKRDYFMLAATWPDIVRDRNFETRYKKYHHSNWHYSDTFWTMKDGKAELLPSPDDNGKAMEKLMEFDKLIRGNASDAQKAIAIAWLEHLIGDIHQPLHSSARVTDTEPKGDQGGNLFLLTPKGTPRENQETLHWFWDSIVIRSIPNKNDSCEADFIDPIAQRIMKKYPFEKEQARLSPGNFDAWRAESLGVAETEAYPPDLKRFEMPSPNYKKKAMKIAEERLALAGYRMADIFNSAFGNAK